MRPQGAGGASRGPRQADRRADIHQGLVEVASAARRQQALGQGADRLPAAGVAEDATEHALEVSVHGWEIEAEGDAADGAGHVLPHPGQGPQAGFGAGQEAAVV